jgi:hemolysin activation/secretion protein
MSGSITTGGLGQHAINEGAKLEGIYARLNLGFSGNMALTTKTSAAGSIKLQKALAGDTLDSSEQMFISGTTGVKTYTDTVSGDNGYVLNMEVKRVLPTIVGITHSAGLFVDNGGIYAQNSRTTTNSKTLLSDVGLGYYVRYRQLFGIVQVAQPLGSMADNSETGCRTRGLVQVGLSF